MLGITSYGMYLLASILMHATPGVDTMYIMGRSVAQGRKAGVYSVLGISTGVFVHTLLAAFGLAVILQQSVVLFTAVKIAGAAYLVYLGIKMMRQPAPPALESEELAPMKLKKIYWQGVTTNVMNPKVALFFLSFLPQFIQTDQPYGPLPFLLLGLSFVVTSTMWGLGVVYVAALATKRVRQNAKMALLVNRLTGIMFIGLGVKLLQTKAS
ncbi:LysE family translocator [Geobacillus subterraneus]|uniref:LysE family translocator n=1 Tax=Geobacillus subterraneus TaxID=129338 RepID=UPI001442C661|nr:LysE family translocator [Geobacillus subterraneus]QIZ68769.1 LysE family translocator [Geobacillus subterraneus]